MYYPRYRPQHRSHDWLDDRSRRTRSEDFGRPNVAKNDAKVRQNDENRSTRKADSSTSDPNCLVEETLKEIRSRKSSETASANVGVDSRRLSCEEIDQMLSHIRSRSQSLSGVGATQLFLRRQHWGKVRRSRAALIVQLVQHSKHDHKFEGLNPVAACNG
jgi:hypothetical protein